MRYLLLTLLVCICCTPKVMGAELDDTAANESCSMSEFMPIDSLRATPARPKIKFLQSIINVGTVSVSNAKPKKYYFEYMNTGTAPLVIEGAETSCGCTQPVVKKGNSVKPGKKGKLQVNFDPREMEDRGTIGNLITVYVNGPQEYVRIRLVGTLKD